MYLGFLPTSSLAKRRRLSPWLGCFLVFFLAARPTAHAQLPFMNAGPDSAFAQIDFAQLYLDTGNREMAGNIEAREARKRLVSSGVVSAFDLAAPDNAVSEFNRAATLMKEQKAKDAIVHFQKAISKYPKFVSAHNALGLAYLDQDDSRARNEFETAAKLDDKFEGSFVNLGLFALSKNEFLEAESNLERASEINPMDARALSALAFAQNGNRDFEKTLATVQRVHGLEHRGMANVHYLAASAALSLHRLDTVKAQLNIFLSEDPTSPMAPVARHNLDLLSHPASTQKPANSEHLQSELSGAAEESASPSGPTPEEIAAVNSTPASTLASNSSAELPPPPPSQPAVRTWVIHQTVEETDLFFAVSHRGHMVNDLELANVQLKDDGKAPSRIVQFLPQSKLPLRLGLLIDTSGSVRDRFTFEKHAAEEFLDKILNGTSDLGFVAGFNSETAVTQDFSLDSKKLEVGIEQLKNGGGTALFDAVSFACWKLGAYPETERVARVLVILSDGDDNSSHRSLKQSIHDAEASGVTVYTVSTRDDAGPKSDADQILQALAERSGGESMFPGEMLALGKSLDRLRDLIRSRYLLAYKPADFEPNGKFRTINIQAEKDGKRLQVHVRKGYYARVEGTQN